MMNIEKLQQKYTALYGIEGCAEGELGFIEHALDNKLPEDFKEIASFYSGGFLGGISHYKIASSGDATNIVQETLRIRSAIGLGKEFIVLAEPSGSIIVLDVLRRPAVIWCDAVDADNINTMNFSNKPDT